MNYQSYDEYMRGFMGYPNMRTSMNTGMNMGMNQTMNPNMNAGMNMGMNTGMSPFMNMDTCSDEDLERMYPETYRVIYPMVCFSCDNLRTPITESTVDMMTDDIYDRVEADGRINVEVSVEVRSDEDTQENRQRRPRRRNRFLRDLIRILLLRELFRRRRRFPMRPF